MDHVVRHHPPGSFVDSLSMSTSDSSEKVDDSVDVVELSDDVDDDDVSDGTILLTFSVIFLMISDAFRLPEPIVEVEIGDGHDPPANGPEDRAIS
nr:unnamed protein product [Spirometra erinaceieuropaei]